MLVLVVVVLLLMGRI
ncbi:MAG: hypothetical protein KDB11_09725 [Planctomycetales bacterium]|nr:hypothetical protein [Planctomycetales bacterium]